MSLSEGKFNIAMLGDAVIIGTNFNCLVMSDG